MVDEPKDHVVDAVETLSKAETPAALAAAHRAARKAVLTARKSKTFGPLARAYAEAMALWDQLKANGSTLEERLTGLDAVLRQFWPRQREWHYICHACNDTGLEMHVCRRHARCDGISTRTDGPFEAPGKYRRLCALHPDSDYTHDYGAPCLCEKGARFRSKPKAVPEDFQSAGKSRSMTRLGRR